MANHINGIRLRVYHELLTNAMLENLHATKHKKKAEEEIKRKAQRKAWECVAKAKQSRLQVSNVKTMIVIQEDYIEQLTL